MQVKNPTLTVRAMAEILRLPAYEQARVLHEQKYPKQQPQSFRTPYYSLVLAGIREFYRAGNDPAVLTDVRNKLQQVGSSTRRANNNRVVDLFEKNAAQFSRKLVPESNTRYVATLSNLELRLSTDMIASDRKRRRYIYYNCRGVALGRGIAEDALHIAHWVLEQNDVQEPIDTIEFIDLFSSRTYRLRRRRSGTQKALEANARIIEALWPTL